MLPTIALTDVSCRRGERVLWRGLNHELAAGRATWLRGRNGRGKTSLLRLVAGLSRPHAGQITWGGEPVHASAGFRAQLVWIAHVNALKDDLTAAEALSFLTDWHGVACTAAAVREALARLHVPAQCDVPVRRLSQGQRRRVALARLALEQRPGVWLLDEPFDALDDDGVQCVESLMSEHLARGGSVLYASHVAPRSDGLRAQVLDLDRCAT